MTVQSVERMLEQAARLTSAERLLLAARLIEGVRKEIPKSAGVPLKWRDLRGMLPYPACGEDAQAFISRTRREDTEHRERRLKRTP